jgi:hypothetical protein
MWWDPNGWSHQAYVCFLGWVKSGKQTGGILGEHLRVLGVILPLPSTCGWREVPVWECEL